MKKTILISIVMLMASFCLYAAPKKPASLVKWQSGANVDWGSLSFRYSGVKGEDWRDKFSPLVDRIDADLGDKLWGMILMAKAGFHQDNLWILTSGNDSLVGAMIDVEWAFDRIFLAYVSPKPGTKNITGLKKGDIDMMLLTNVYDKNVGEKINALLEIKGLRYDRNSEGTKFAESIKKWSVYNTVGWNNDDSTVQECPDKYFKHMGRGHQRSDIRDEWVRVQNTLADFRQNTAWIREKGDKKINKALDDCEESIMNYFSKYVKGFYAVEMNKTFYAEVMPQAIDVLCMEYVTAVREKNEGK